MTGLAAATPLEQPFPLRLRQGHRPGRQAVPGVAVKVGAACHQQSEAVGELLVAGDRRGVVIGMKDLQRVEAILGELAHAMYEEEAYRNVILEEPSVWGLQSFGPEFMTVRLALKTAPLEQWAVAREMRARIKARFDAEGIAMPLPQRVVYHRQQPADEPQKQGDREEASQRA